MLKSDLYPELDPIARGSTYKKLFDWLYSAAQLRYTTKDHLNRLNHQFGTPKKLAKLCEAGFLMGSEFYVITEKTRGILKAEDYNTRILQKDFNGQVAEHQLKITDFVLKIMAEPHFYAVIYPNFTDLIPDACVIFKNGDLLKVEMLEVEEEKGNWLDYLTNKKTAYEKLAHDLDIYHKWWKVWSARLDLPYCQEKYFCFSIRCNAKITQDWEGWKWQV